MKEKSGVLLLDKPAGPTCRTVLGEIEKRILVGPLGHAGTLDPMASGLLIALSGRARRLQEFFTGRDKTYVARVRFGETSRTLDSEGPVESTGVAPAPINPPVVERLLKTFEGHVLQAPPVFSALRVDGVRAHRHARHGREVDLEPRRVVIHRIALLAVEDRDWVVEVTCGPGVYIRSLARDLGAARGCGAYLASLRRTRSGPIRVEDAIAPSEADLPDLRPLSELLAAEPRIEVSEEEALTLCHGKVIQRDPEAGSPEPRFAWFGNRPCFRLVAPGPGVLRSDLLIEEPRSISEGSGPA